MSKLILVVDDEVGIRELLAEILFLGYSFSSNNVTGATFYVALIPFGLGLWFYTSIKNKIEDAFMEQFAAANGLTFQKYGLPGNLDKHEMKKMMKDHWKK